LEQMIRARLGQSGLSVVRGFCRQPQRQMTSAPAARSAPVSSGQRAQLSFPAHPLAPIGAPGPPTCSKVH